MDEELLAIYPELEKSHFWWVGRRRLINQLLDSFMMESLGEVLDVGCGSGVLAAELATRGAQVSAVDVTLAPSLDAAEFRFIQGDYLSLSVELGQFDIVLALDVLEHIEDEASMVKSLRENTRPDGHLVVTVPAYQWLWSEHDVVNHHYRRYTKESLSEALGQGGFKVERVGNVFLGLILPKAIEKTIERVTGRPQRVRDIPVAINNVANAFFRTEHRIALSRKHFLPLGTSVLAVCTRV